MSQGDEGHVTGCQTCGRSVFWQMLAQYVINQVVGEDQRLGVALSPCTAFLQEWFLLKEDHG